jgi:hypothetical protein
MDCHILNRTVIENKREKLKYMHFYRKLIHPLNYIILKNFLTANLGNNIWGEKKIATEY